MGDQRDERASMQGDPEETRRAFLNVDSEPTDPRAKEAALRRLRDASDEELAVFEGKLREDALEAGASEQEIREAQSGHPEHG
ncbi:MAG: hypothetical protein E6G34_06640 [Actinobacteria bacterium]|nr:MAG: hypothetical protein E6G34_06640 [Actinomycetota bacterium]